MSVFILLFDSNRIIVFIDHLFKNLILRRRIFEQRFFSQKRFITVKVLFFFHYLNEVLHSKNELWLDLITYSLKKAIFVWSEQNELMISAQIQILMPRTTNIFRLEPLHIIIIIQQMEKSLQLILIIIVLIVQPLHIAAGSRYLKTGMYLDDKSSKSYTAWDSRTVSASYPAGFAIFVGGITLILYGILLFVEILKYKLDGYKPFLIFFSGALLQMAVAVSTGIQISQDTGPDGGHATAVQTEFNYALSYRLNVADTVATFVLCVPATIILTALTVKRSRESVSKISHEASGIKIF